MRFGQLYLLARKQKFMAGAAVGRRRLQAAIFGVTGETRGVARWRGFECALLQPEGVFG